MADAGVAVDEIDGVCCARLFDAGPGDRPAMELAEYLGVRPTYTDSNYNGGASPLLHMMRAALAVEHGLCNVVLVACGSMQATRRESSLGGFSRPLDQVRHIEMAAGLPHPLGVAALAASRHMHLYGTTAEQLAAIAVSQRSWASLNPAALRREPLTVDDVLSSAMICSPLHKLDVCLRTDGAGAVILRRCRGNDIDLLGFGEAHSHFSMFGSEELTRTVAGDSSWRALRMAGLGIGDVDMLQVYDAFTILNLVLLEDIGFCEKGEGGPFVQSGATRPDGSLPMNTQGGGLSHAHPGMYGIYLVIEAVRQLRNDAPGRQVEGRVAMCHASGGGAFGSSQATLLLGA